MRVMTDGFQYDHGSPVSLFVCFRVGSWLIFLAASPRAQADARVIKLLPAASLRTTPQSGPTPVATLETGAYKPPHSPTGRALRMTRFATS